MQITAMSLSSLPSSILSPSPLPSVSSFTPSSFFSLRQYPRADLRHYLLVKKWKKKEPCTNSPQTNAAVSKGGQEARGDHSKGQWQARDPRRPLVVTKSIATSHHLPVCVLLSLSITTRSVRHTPGREKREDKNKRVFWRRRRHLRMNVLYELVRQPAVFGTVSHLTNASTAWPDTKTQLFLHWRGKKTKKTPTQMLATGRDNYQKTSWGHNVNRISRRLDKARTTPGNQKNRLRWAVLLETTISRAVVTRGHKCDLLSNQYATAKIFFF